MAKKKGNNYIIDTENNIAKIELNRTKAENLWAIIDLEDLQKERSEQKIKEQKQQVGLS